MDITLVSVRAGDWQGLYVDGVLVFEGHKVRLLDLFTSVDLGANFSQRETTDAEELASDVSGRMPQTVEGQ